MLVPSRHAQACYQHFDQTALCLSLDFLNEARTCYGGLIKNSNGVWEQLPWLRKANWYHPRIMRLIARPKLDHEVDDMKTAMIDDSR